MLGRIVLDLGLDHPCSQLLCVLHCPSLTQKPFSRAKILARNDICGLKLILNHLLFSLIPWSSLQSFCELIALGSLTSLSMNLGWRNKCHERRRVIYQSMVVKDMPWTWVPQINKLSMSMTLSEQLALWQSSSSLSLSFFQLNLPSYSFPQMISEWRLP